jgi:acyl-coenzyme A synthetase/AMP-(fatty) acid ligase/acyl carrier protein
MGNGSRNQISDALALPQTIAGLFLRQAEETPHALAVADDRSSVTYEQLAGLASGITRQIMDKTGGGEARICILAPQNITAVAGMLGVLLAGKCFVPLLPQENDVYLRYLWENSESSLIICAPEDEKRAAAICDDPKRVVVVAEVPVLQDLFHPENQQGPDGISAIMYTSGSTGRPKGVMTTGQAILRRAMQHVEMARITSADRQIAFVPWQFASAFPDIFAPLLVGASLFMYESRHHGVERLGSFIKKNEITLLKLPASLIQRFVQSTSADSLRSVRYVHCGGGCVKVKDAKLLLGILPDNAVLMHGFASTETNLVTFREWKLSAPLFTADFSPVLLPAGYPVPGKRIQIVDEQGNPVVTGQEGELVVISRDIFPGYFRQPDMTAGCLKELPGGERVFYTGDLARIHEDGCLEVVGRKGNRVKIRGLRIDLGAVDSILQSLPYVRDAAASVSFSGREAKLVSYLEIVEGKIVTTTQLREDLKNMVPAYMIPSRFVFVENLPKTASGKIDRNALLAPGRKRPGLANPYEPPRTDLEKLLADIWADVLEIDEVGIHDHFLELGGDSLMIVEMGMRLEHEFGDKVKISLLMQASTIAEMARMIETPKTRYKKAVNVKIPLRWWLKNIRRSIKARLIRVSPRLEPYTPSYKLLISFQKLWLSLAPVRLLYKRKTLIFKSWLALIDSTDESGELMMHNLMANTWKLGRNILMAQKNNFEKFVSIIGWEHVHNALDAGKGAIFITPHTHIFFTCLREQLTLKMFSEVNFLGQRWLPPDRATKTAGLAGRLQEAHNVLRRGGAVWIMGDGKQGTVKMVQSRFGRRFAFRAGAPELAVQTGAPLIPVFPSLRPDGGLVVEFLPPLEQVQKGPRAFRVEYLLKQYSEMYVGRWPQMLPNMQTGHQRKRLSELERSDG